MRERHPAGANPAWIPDVAGREVRMPDDALVDDEAVTLDEFLKRRDCETPPDFLPPAAVTDRYGTHAPFDDFTVDAEILVERYGLAVFTSADLAYFLGIAHSTVATRRHRGNLPAPRYPAPSQGEPGLWTAAQVVELVAAELRKAAHA